MATDFRIVDRDRSDRLRTAKVRRGRLFVSSEPAATAVLLEEQPFFRFADENGDGTGNREAIGDYSVTSKDFFLQAQPFETLHIRKIVIVVRDTGVFRSDRYGAMGALLVNGIRVLLTDSLGTIIKNIDDGEGIRSNDDWAALTFDLGFFNFAAGPNTMVVAFKVDDSGSPIQLNPGDRLVFCMNDDLTFLERHKFNLSGSRVFI